MMKRFLIACSCLLVVAVAGCSSKKAEESASSPAAQPAAPAAAPAAEAPPAAPAKVEFTDALVLKYLDYQKQQLTIVSKYVEQSRKNLESAKGDASKMVEQLSINEKLSKEMDAALAAKRTELGLSPEQFEALQDAVSMIANGRLLYNQMGGDAQLAKMQAEQKKQVAALPEAQRAEAEKTFEEMSKGLTEIKNGGELRKKYGDQAADLLMKHADALAQQQEEVYKLLKKK